MADCVMRLVLDGRERDCLETEPGHNVHKYRRTQGRDPFLYVQFVDLASVVQVDVVPAPGASAPVPGAGPTTGSVVAAGPDDPRLRHPSAGGSSVWAGRDARTGTP